MRLSVGMQTAGMWHLSKHYYVDDIVNVIFDSNYII